MTKPQLSANRALPTHTLPKLPALVAGRVAHSRLEVVGHRFRHGTYQWLVDLDAIPEQPWYLRPFASFSPADHLGDPGRSIRENVERYLGLNGIELGGSSRIAMLANARVLGHVFDPLSVFWCFDANMALVCFIAEVRNTYGGRTVDLLRTDPPGAATRDKAFHVSPFLDVSGRYEMRFALSPRTVATTVVLHRGGKAAFTATFRGRPRPASTMAVVGQLLRRPLMPQQVSALLRVNGIWLWLRRLPILRRPQHQPQEGV